MVGITSDPNDPIVDKELGVTLEAMLRLEFVLIEVGSWLEMRTFNTQLNVSAWR